MRAYTYPTEGQEFTFGEKVIKVVDLDPVREALSKLIDYTERILTGPIMQAAGVEWPEGGPNGPILKLARVQLEELIKIVS